MGETRDREVASVLAEWIEREKSGDYWQHGYDPRPDIERVLAELAAAREQLHEVARKFTLAEEDARIYREREAVAIARMEDAENDAANARSSRDELLAEAREREANLREALRNLPLWKLDDEEDAVSVKTAREAIEGGEHDPDYSPAYQDEYQRLWHKTAQERATLRRAAIDFCANETLQVYGRRWYELTHLLLPNGNEGLDAEGIRERLAALSEGEG